MLGTVEIMQAYLRGSANTIVRVARLRLPVLTTTACCLWCRVVDSLRGLIATVGVLVASVWTAILDGVLGGYSTVLSSAYSKQGEQLFFRLCEHNVMRVHSPPTP